MTLNYRQLVKRELIFRSLPTSPSKEEEEEEEGKRNFQEIVFGGFQILKEYVT